MERKGKFTIISSSSKTVTYKNIRLVSESELYDGPMYIDILPGACCGSRLYVDNIEVAHHVKQVIVSDDESQKFIYNYYVVNRGRIGETKWAMYGGEIADDFPVYYNIIGNGQLLDFGKGAFLDSHFNQFPNLTNSKKMPQPVGVFNCQIFGEYLYLLRHGKIMLYDLGMNLVAELPHPLSNVGGVGRNHKEDFGANKRLLSYSKNVILNEHGKFYVYNIVTKTRVTEAIFTGVHSNSKYVELTTADGAIYYFNDDGDLCFSSDASEIQEFKKQFNTVKRIQITSVSDISYTNMPSSEYYLLQCKKEGEIDQYFIQIGNHILNKNLQFDKIIKDKKSGYSNQILDFNYKYPVWFKTDENGKQQGYIGDDCCHLIIELNGEKDFFHVIENIAYMYNRWDFVVEQLFDYYTFMSPDDLKDTIINLHKEH